MKLRFDGDVDEYSPTLGLTFFVGEHEYPDERKAELLATKRFKVVQDDKTPKKVKE
jgi:hypothetical protein